MMPMANNPMMAIIQAAQSGGNPMALMQQLAKNNPKAKLAMQMMQGKNPQQMRTMCENMCKERGTTVEQVAQQLGIPIPGGK